MYFDIKDLIKFYYDTNLGKRTTLSLNRTLNHLFDCGKSEIVLGFGFTTPLIKSYVDNSIRTISLMPGLQGAMTWPESRNNINALVEETLWPIETETVDTAILLHGLEMSLNPPKLLSEVWRVLKPNGVLLILEFSRPTNTFFSKVYDWYSFNIIPRLGGLLVNDSESYQYLAESIRMHPDQETLRDMVFESGFTECKFYNLVNGVVAIHKAK